MLFNTDATLWLNYGRTMAPQSPSRFVSLTIHPEGDLSNGREHLARFASREDAVQCLIGAGWAIDGDLARFSSRKIEIAQNPSYPRFSVIVDGLWDTECASNSEAETLEAARDRYPDEKIIMWDNPAHYSQA